MPKPGVSRGVLFWVLLAASLWGVVVYRYCTPDPVAIPPNSDRTELAFNSC